MGLFTYEETNDYRGFGSVAVHNRNVDYVCWCHKCYDSYGIRNQYGMDEYCPKCGEPLDWENNEEEW